MFVVRAAYFATWRDKCMTADQTWTLRHKHTREWFQLSFELLSSFQLSFVIVCSKWKILRKNTLTHWVSPSWALHLVTHLSSCIQCSKYWDELSIVNYVEQRQALNIPYFKLPCAVSMSCGHFVLAFESCRRCYCHGRCAAVSLPPHSAIKWTLAPT